MLHAPLLKGFLIFLVVAGVIVPLFHRARVGTVLGFLIAGVALGPQGLGRLAGDYPWVAYVTFDDPQRGEPLAEFGIMMLLFLLGLELSLKRLWELRRYVLGVGLAQVVVTSLAIGAILRASGAIPPSGLILGLCLALSSTAIVMQLLAEQHRVAHPVGRIALSVLLLQDMMVVPILFIVGLLAAGNRSVGILALIMPFAQAFGAVFAIMLIGRFVVNPLLRSAVRTGSRDLIMAITLLIVVVFSLATGLAGLSVALGAFLAGLLLSDSEARHQIEVDLEPFKGLLLGIFFITVGTHLDLFAVAGDAGWVLLAVIVLMVVKSVILFVAARLFRVPAAQAIEVALLLAQGGEFAFVVLSQAQGLLSPRLATAAIAVVALSMMVTPVAAYLARALAAPIARRDNTTLAPPPEIDLSDHVVIGGAGRVGQMIGVALAAENVPFVCLDTNADAIMSLRARGWQAYYGDASRHELLERVGGEHARAFVVTLGNRRAAEHMVAAARKISRRALIFARAADFEHAARMVKLGAVGVIPETVEASLHLATRVMEGLDVPSEAIEQRIAAMRAEELDRLDRAEFGA